MRFSCLVRGIVRALSVLCLLALAGGLTSTISPPFINAALSSNALSNPFQTILVTTSNAVSYGAPLQDISAPFDWYRYQGKSDSGSCNYNNCGPTSVAMAIQFAHNNQWVSVGDVRNYLQSTYPGLRCDWVNMDQMRNALSHWGVNYTTITGMDAVRDAINNRGHIVIVPVLMSSISTGSDYLVPRSDPGNHYGRYYDYSSYHILVAKGISSDNNWVIAYDPNVWDGNGKYWYSDGSAKGKNRYYSYSEFATAFANNGNRAIEITDTPGGTPQPTPTSTPLPSTPRPLLSSPLNGETFGSGQRVIFEWLGVSSVSHFEISVWRSGSLYRSVSTTSAASSWDVGVLPDGSYTWQVTAVGSSGRASSRIWSFTIGSSPTTNSATFVTDVSYPDGSILSPGQSFNKTWRLRNSGTSTWSGFTLSFVGGDRMNGSASAAVPTTAPGETADITVPLVAPSGGGDYRGNWQLKDSQGVTVPGGNVWVSIKVIANVAPPTGHITSFDVTPSSPSSASSVHLVARATYFPQFRSMRFVIGTEKVEMPNYRQVGGQVEISTDWNTASLARGTYALAVEVATKDDPNWTGAERQVKTYTLTGTPAPTGRPPDRPVLKEPYDWYVRDASGAAASVNLCVYPSSDPDGDTVQYFFQILNQIGDPIQNSGWTTSACYSPTLSPGIYGWKVKAGNNNGALASDWSQDTWHFSVASGEVAVGDINFYQLNTNETHACVSVTFGGIIAPDVYAWVNRAADGSESGEWRLLDHYGPNTTPDCTRSDLHGFWIRSPEYVTGRHAFKVTAIKRDPDHNPVSSATKSTSFDIAYIRPSDFQPLAPSTSQNNGTFWNNPSITFQWTPALRADNYQVRVSTSSDIWNDPAPLVNTTVSGSATSYTHNFAQDYGRLYWSVRAVNSAGYADLGSALWFGIDRMAPTSSVQALSAVTYESVFQVNWSGTDNSAGIGTYDIQYMDSSRGTWTDWLLGVPAAKTYDLFTGEPGHTYYFRSRATDNAGNTESYPLSADTSIKVDPVARPQTPWWNTAYASKRNIPVLNNMPSTTLPAGYPVRLHFDNGTTPTAAQIYNASQSSTKCDDLRIVYNDATELDRLVQNCSSTSIDIWLRNQVAISGGSSNGTAHQLYYGNPSATNPPASRNQVLYPVLDSSHLRVFDMREGAGSTLYDLVGGVNATISSELSWDPSGKFGPALLFPGDRTPEPRPAVNAGVGPQPGCEFSVELWLRRLTDHQYGGMLAQQEIGGPNPWRWMLKIDGERLRLDVEGTASSVQSAGTLSASTFFSNWHHVAVTHSCSGEVRFYIDGRLDSVRTMSTGSVNPAVAPLRLGNNAYNNNRLAGYMSGFALSSAIRTNFSYGQYADIINEPSVTVGTPIDPPVIGSADLAVLSLTTYPNPDGGVLVQAVVKNQGTRGTQNGFWIDLYRDRVPAGAGDTTGSIRYWVASPIDAGATITVTTAVTDINSLSANGVSPRSFSPASDTSSTLYAQADSTGSVAESSKSNNISSGSEICTTTTDAFEGDDSSAAANAISTSGTVQAHNFHAFGDQDWVSFTATAGVTYTVSTANLGANADTVLSLYGSDGATLLASNDDYGNSHESRIAWTASENGTYFVKLVNWNSYVAGCGTNYTFSITLPSYQLYLPLVGKNTSTSW